ncbi:hypothetical protein PO909_024938 [Leuciscus waleckii]
MTVYAKDIMSRMDHIKARITFVFGYVLKMDSTKKSKRLHLQQEGVPGITDAMVDKNISKEELALHCRRRTRGQETTIRLIDHLLQELMGEKGKDLLGVPLLDRVRMANSLNFQLFLLEGLNRWDQDRAAQSLATKPSNLLSYSGDLVQSVNANSLKVLHRKQTGQALQDMNPDSEETDELLEDLNFGQEQEDEGFEDQDLDPTVGNLMTSTSVPVPAAFSASTLPAAFSASTLPAALSVSTQSAAFSASTLPAAFSASTHPAAFSASTQPVTFSASTQPTSASTQSAAFSASTLPTSASTQSAAFSASTQPTSASIQHVDEHNMPRMDRVDTLAEYLVSLRNHTGLTLSNKQVSTIIGLWQNLLPFDQQRVVFAARHQDRLIAGKFRSPRQSLLLVWRA